MKQHNLKPACLSWLDIADIKMGEDKQYLVEGVTKEKLLKWRVLILRFAAFCWCRNSNLAIRGILGMVVVGKGSIRHYMNAALWMWRHRYQRRRRLLHRTSLGNYANRVKVQYLALFFMTPPPGQPSMSMP